MFAYCYNNPICHVDNSGSVPVPVWVGPLLKSIGIGFGVGALAGVLSGLGELITGGSKDEAVEEAKNGFAIGLISHYVPVVGVITTVISAIDAGAESRSAGASKEESILVVGISLATSFWQMDGDGVPYNVMNEMLGFSGSLISNSVSKGINGKAAYLQKNNSAAGNRCTTGVIITAGKGGAGGRTNRYVALM